jgi:hypothetical protein
MRNALGHKKNVLDSSALPFQMQDQRTERYTAINIQEHEFPPGTLGPLDYLHSSIMLGLTNVEEPIPDTLRFRTTKESLLDMNFF